MSPTPTDTPPLPPVDPPRSLCLMTLVFVRKNDRKPWTLWRRLFPAHLDAIGEHSQKVTPATNVPPTHAAFTIFDGHAVNFLTSRSRPEKWAAKEQKPLPLDDSKPVHSGPILQ